MCVCIIRQVNILRHLPMSKTITQKMSQQSCWCEVFSLLCFDSLTNGQCGVVVRLSPSDCYAAQVCVTVTVFVSSTHGVAQLWCMLMSQCNQCRICSLYRDTYLAQVSRFAAWLLVIKNQIFVNINTSFFSLFFCFFSFLLVYLLYDY